MNRFLVILFVLCVAFLSNAEAADRITATIAVTNAPLGNSNTITINGNIRTFTNAVTGSPGTLVQQTNSIPWTATNLINQLTDYRVSQFHFLGQSASNNVRITGTVGEALTVSLAGLWGTITYSTQNVTIANVVRVPMSAEYDTNRAWIASLTVLGLSDYATNGFSTNAAALANYVSKGASALQEIISPVLFSGGLRGSNVRQTNGFTSAFTNINSVSSNHVNFGNAIRSEGSGGNSFQAGSNALAVGTFSVAIGNGSIASNTTTLAIGTEAKATNDYSMAVGNSAIAGGTDTLAVGRGAQAYESSAMAVGQGAIAQGTGAVALQSEVTGNSSIGIGASSSVSATNSTVVGPGATSVYNDSSAFGKNATTTTTNQIRLGTSSDTVSIPGMLDVSGTITNINATGTNRISGQLVFVPVSNAGLANGYNAGVAINSAYVKFSGPSAAYTNAGFSAANKMDGRMHFCQFDNPGLSMTLLHDSGLDPGNSTNRIYTGTGALLNSTNRVVHVIMSYDDSVTAWRVWSFR